MRITMDEAKKREFCIYRHKQTRKIIHVIGVGDLVGRSMSRLKWGYPEDADTSCGVVELDLYDWDELEEVEQEADR